MVDLNEAEKFITKASKYSKSNYGNISRWTWVEITDLLIDTVANLVNYAKELEEKLENYERFGEED